MINSPRRRSSFALRLLAFLLFAAGLALQPVLASLGELHEMADHSTGGHAHVQSSAEGLTDFHGDMDVDHDGSTPDPLHTLIHLAHCCGQSGTFDLPALDVIRAMLQEVAPLMGETQTVGRAHAHGPFRPPIAA